MGREKLNLKWVCSENQCICISAIRSGASLRYITMLGSNQAFLEHIQPQQEAMGTPLQGLPPRLFNCAHLLNHKGQLKVICIQCNGKVNRKHYTVWPPVEGERDAWPPIPLRCFSLSLIGWFYLCQHPVLTKIPSVQPALLNTFQGQLCLLPFLATAVWIILGDSPRTSWTMQGREETLLR